MELHLEGSGETQRHFNKEQSEKREKETICQSKQSALENSGRSQEPLFTPDKEMFRLPVIDGSRREEKQGRRKKITDKFEIHRTQ